MRRQVRGLNKSAENIQEGVGFVQTADGALNEVNDMLQRMTELIVKASNDTMSPEDREAIDQEIQQLKREMSRVFSETSFNERKIWEPSDKVFAGYESVPAVEPANRGQKRFDVTNDNYDVIPYTDFKVSANETDGVSVSWKAMNGTTYRTENIPWDEFEQKNYRVNIADYYGAVTGPNADLFDGAGNPVFDYPLALSVNENASRQDIIDSIHNKTISNGASTSMSTRFEDGQTRQMSAGATLNYPAAYASKKNDALNGHNFDAADDLFLEPKLTGTTNLIAKPSATTVADAKTSTEGWKFAFDMKGIGGVTATSKSISYRAYDYDAEDEGRWWDWHTYSNGSRYKATILHSKTPGDLGALMSTLTGDEGVLGKNVASGEAGNNDGSGQITIHFDLKSDVPYSYGGGASSTSVGSFQLSIPVNQGDTQESILQRINESLNGNTVLDCYTSSQGNDSFYYYGFEPTTKMINSPVYEGKCKLDIQAGTEAGQFIPITYESLSLRMLGLKDTNVLSRDSIDQAIGEVKKALQIVSKQRADFGAQQNRLEHAYNINKNVEENTQAAESAIRDTDMAKEMITLSLQNILGQAGEAMMAQANQYSVRVLDLLQ